MAEIPNFDAARMQAVHLLFDYLVAERGFTAAESYAIISAAGDVEFGGPVSAVVLASVPNDL